MPFELPDVTTMDRSLRHRARYNADDLVFAMGSDSVTFAQLDHDVNAIAGALLERGIEPRDRVAILAPSSIDFIRLFMATQRIGAIPCAFDPHVPPETAVRRAMRIRPKALLLAGSAATDLKPAAANSGAIDIDELRRSNRSVPVVEAGDADVAFLQTTSGTSGEPRFAVITNRNVAAAMENGKDVTGLHPTSILVSWLPPWHDLGLIRFVLTPIVLALPTHFVKPAIRTIPDWLAAMTALRATVSAGPDFALRLATRFADATVDLSSIRHFSDGGEPVKYSTIEAFERRFKVPGVVRPGYGLAEATLGVAVSPDGEPLRLDDRGNVSCGPPLPNVACRIADDGEILVRGEQVFAGYFDEPEATREVLRDGWLRTGDIGSIDADGYLFILGRKRALLKRGGALLAPRELEEAAQRVRGVRVAAAIGIPSEDEGTERIIVAIEADDPSDASLAGAVAHQVEEVVGFAPERVVVLPPRSIPITENGKIRHMVLREMLIGSPQVA